MNELLKREISQVMHTRYRGRTTAITITGVDTAANLRRAVVSYSVVGDEGAQAEARAFFREHGKEVQVEVGRKVVLKYFPLLEFKLDRGAEHGARIDEIFEELGLSSSPEREGPPPQS
ncbi:MAG: ribosome-binding factor A [Opitutales bacterium]